VGKVTTWKFNDPNQPSFPADFEVVKKAVLQKTDIKANNNKYYAIELHSANGKSRVFTHYGRTDDLETNPDAGTKECRYGGSMSETEAIYNAIFAQKTSKKKNYKEVSLASSKIGSQQARGTSSGEIDAKTLEAQAKTGKEKKKKKAKPSITLTPPVAELVKYIFAEATNALTTTVAAKITAHGIETPLGVLTIGQIEKGEAILSKIHGAMTKKAGRSRLEELSGEFYTVIPHRIGRTRQAISAAVIDTMTQFGEKQDTLQLMRDMLQVNGEEGSVLHNNETVDQYKSLGATLAHVSPSSKDWKRLADYVVKSQVKSKSIKVKNIFTVRREQEHKEFTEHIKNQRLLFHGSRIQNWVGLLSRGILMPKVVVKMGVNRTDAGWLGNGIYFGDAACTSSYYTSSGRKGTRFMAIANVALGKMKNYNRITYGITAPPPGYDSCHGVRGTEFSDDEYVIYDGKQQRMDYLVEFTR